MDGNMNPWGDALITLRIFQVFDDMFQHHHGHWQAHEKCLPMILVRWKSLIFFFSNRKYIMITMNYYEKIGECSGIFICLSKDKCQRLWLLRLSSRRPFFNKKCSCFFSRQRRSEKNPSRSPTRTPRSTDRVYDVYSICPIPTKIPTNRPSLGAWIQTKTNLLLKNPPQDHVSLNGTWWVPGVGWIYPPGTQDSSGIFASILGLGVVGGGEGW